MTQSLAGLERSLSREYLENQGQVVVVLHDAGTVQAFSQLGGKEKGDEIQFRTVEQF